MVFYLTMQLRSKLELMVWLEIGFVNLRRHCTLLAHQMRQISVILIDRRVMFDLSVTLHGALSITHVHANCGDVIG